MVMKQEIRHQDEREMMRGDTQKGKRTWGIRGMSGKGGQYRQKKRKPMRECQGTRFI